MAFATPNVGKSKYTGYTYEGKEIVLTKTRGRGSKRDHHNVEWYPEDKKVEVATMYAVTRNVEQTSKFTDIAPYLIRKWKSEPWFSNVVSRVIKENNDVLDASITDIIQQCTKEIKDRLVKGDARGVNFKTGEVYTTPVDARTLATVMGILFDKRQLIRGEATSRTENISFDKRLENLKTTFERFSKATQIEAEEVSSLASTQEAEPINEDQSQEPQREGAGENPQALLEATRIEYDQTDKQRAEGGLREGQEPLQGQPDAS